MTQHTVGIYKATKRIVNAGNFNTDSSYLQQECIKQIIEEETYYVEMLTFIEKVRLVSLADHAALIALKREALELIEKVKGLK